MASGVVTAADGAAVAVATGAGVAASCPFAGTARENAVIAMAAAVRILTLIKGRWVMVVGLDRLVHGCFPDDSSSSGAASGPKAIPVPTLDSDPHHPLSKYPAEKSRNIGFSLAIALSDPYFQPQRSAQPVSKIMLDKSLGKVKYLARRKVSSSFLACGKLNPAYS